MSRCLVLLCCAACSESRFELISRLPDAGAGEDAGADAGNASAPCVDFEQPLGVRFSRVALVPQRPVPIVVGVENGALSSVVLRDGGVEVTPLLMGVASSHFNAISSGLGRQVAFHGPEPSFAVLDSSGRLESAPVSVLMPRLGTNPGWGLRISGDASHSAVVYRTLGADAAFTIVGPGERWEAVLSLPRLGQLDGVLAGERMVLVGVTSAGLERYTLGFDGGVLSGPELLAPGAEGRPFTCPGVTAWTVRDADGGARVEAMDQNVRSVGDGVLGAGSCFGDGALVSLLRSGALHFATVGSTGFQPAPVPVPTLDDHAVLADDDGVWVVLAPRFEPQARLLRRCRP